jgi:hypothetical protein
MAIVNPSQQVQPYQVQALWVSQAITVLAGIGMICYFVSGMLKAFTTKEGEHQPSPGIIVMPKLPEEARGDILFVEYIRDLVKLGETVTDEEARLMWEAWKRQRETLIAS